MAEELIGRDDAAARLVSLPLMLGLVSVPLLFGWLLLRRGYTPSLRRVVFVYAVLTPALWLLSLGIVLLMGSVDSPLN